MRVELTITAKGQVTLRRDVLAHLGLRPGEKVSVSLLPGGRVELVPAGTRHDIRALRGMLHRPDQPAVTVGEMQEAIEAGRLR